MKYLIILLLIYSHSLLAKVPVPNASTGFEAGVARISNGDKALIGPSWMYHFDYRPDEWISFFGQAGNSSGKEDGVRMSQTAFSGGIQFYLLPVLSFRFGFATTVTEVEKVKTKRESELGPLVGAVASIPLGVFTLGTSATIIRTESMNSTALRAFAFITF
jgi:hypothetical protein